MSTNEARNITCHYSGEVFTYSGRGRPPKYAPAHRKAAVAAKRKAARAAAKAGTAL